MATWTLQLWLLGYGNVYTTTVNHYISTANSACLFNYTTAVTHYISTDISAWLCYSIHIPYLRVWKYPFEMSMTWFWKILSWYFTKSRIHSFMFSCNHVPPFHRAICPVLVLHARRSRGSVCSMPLWDKPRHLQSSESWQFSHDRTLSDVIIYRQEGLKCHFYSDCFDDHHFWGSV